MPASNSIRHVFYYNQARNKSEEFPDVIKERDELLLRVKALELALEDVCCGTSLPELHK